MEMELNLELDIDLSEEYAELEKQFTEIVVPDHIKLYSLQLEVVEKTNKNIQNLKKVFLDIVANEEIPTIMKMPLIIGVMEKLHQVKTNCKTEILHLYYRLN